MGIELRLRDDQRDALAGGALDPEAVYVQYHTQGDAHVRPSHAALDGKIFKLGEIDTPAPPIDFGCFLPGTLVSGVFDGATRSFYSGQAVEIRTQNGSVLRVTPNHPIPTEYGTVSARAIKPGWKLLVDTGKIVPVPGQHVNEQNEPTLIEQVYHLTSQLWPVDLARARPDDFHGDGDSIDGNVDIVGSYATLWRVCNSRHAESIGNRALIDVHPPGSFPGSGLGEHGRDARLPTPQFYSGGSMGGTNLTCAGSGSHAAPLNALRVRLTSELDACGQKSLANHKPANTESFGYRIDGLPLLVVRDEHGHIDLGEMKAVGFGPGSAPNTCLLNPDENGLVLNPVFYTDVLRAHSGLVQTNDVADVRFFDYSGHVYDLRSPFGYVIASGIYASNCRCYLTYVSAPDSKASELLPVAPSEPTTRAESFAEYLNRNLGDVTVQKVAEIAAAVPAVQRLNMAYLALIRLRPTIPKADARDLARMIVEAHGR